MTDDDFDPDDTEVTPADLAAAKARYAAMGRLPNELFGSAVTGDGVRGDCLLDAVPDELVGRQVTAKRLGWDDGDDDPDRTPYDEMGYDSPDLSGELSVIRFTLPDGTPGVGCLVGGQEADPKTIRAAD